MVWKSGFGGLVAALLLAGTAVAAELPACLTRRDEGRAGR